MILVPEQPFDINEVASILQHRHERNRYASIVVVAEGAQPIPGTMELPEKGLDEYGHVKLGGAGNIIASELEKRTGMETRVTVHGHIQRGGTPNAFDRVLCTRFGVAAIEAVHEGAAGEMVALQSGSITRVPLAEAVAGLKGINNDIWDTAKVFFPPST